MKQCERCDLPAIGKGRYCREHSKEVLKELRESGYLTPIVGMGSFRSFDKQENVHETKHGTGH